VTKLSTVSGAFQKYIDTLGGPRSDREEELEFAVRIPPPSEAAEDVARHLSSFAQAVASLTNARFKGWMAVAGAAGYRDGAFAIPGRGGPRRSEANLVRPPMVEKLVQLAASAMSEAQANAELYRAELGLKRSVASTSAEVTLGRRRRKLHRFQLTLLALLSMLATAGFGAIAARLNDWPNSSTNLSDAAGSAPTTTSGQYLVAVTFLIVAFGVTVGFFRATRERALAVALRNESRSYLREGTEIADADPLVAKVWQAGLVVSMAIAGLVGVGGYFKLESVSLVRMALGVSFWLVWGAAAYLGSGVMAQLSQHWLNLSPVEVDQTDYDSASAAQNAASAKVGFEYIDDVLASQRAFAGEVGVALIEHYYESNMLSRNASRNEEFDRFVSADIAQARIDLRTAGA
jgi:hypothetical protein